MRAQFIPSGYGAAPAPIGDSALDSVKPYLPWLFAAAGLAWMAWTVGTEASAPRRPARHPKKRRKRRAPTKRR